MGAMNRALKYIQGELAELKKQTIKQQPTIQ